MKKTYRKQMRPGSYVYILEPDTAPLATANGLNPDSNSDDPDEKFHSSEEQSAVLQSLDPFWTRGIIDS